MAIIKGQIHPQNNVSDIIYPETSFDQVKDIALYEHNIVIKGSYDDPDRDDNDCVINASIFSKDPNQVTQNNIVNNTLFTGVCIINNWANKGTFYATVGQFEIISNGEQVDIHLLNDTWTFPIKEFTDTVVNVFNRSIVM